MSARFVAHSLRALDPELARSFYAGVLPERALDVVALPERARGLGAPPHWLPWLAVEDVDGFSARWLERGARRLGPPNSLVFADPGGAVLGLRDAGDAAPGVRHELMCADIERALDDYAPCGWTAGPMVHALGVPYRRVDVGGVVQSVPTGAHPHWLCSFAAADLDAAIAAAIERGGRLTHPVFEGLDGARLASLEDTEGAAFGLWSPR